MQAEPFKEGKLNSRNGANRDDHSFNNPVKRIFFEIDPYGEEDREK